MCVNSPFLIPSAQLGIWGPSHTESENIKSKWKRFCKAAFYNENIHSTLCFRCEKPFYKAKAALQNHFRFTFIFSLSLCEGPNMYILGSWRWFQVRLPDGELGSLPDRHHHLHLEVRLHIHWWRHQQRPQELLFLRASGLPGCTQVTCTWKCNAVLV